MSGKLSHQLPLPDAIIAPQAQRIQAFLRHFDSSISDEVLLILYGSAAVSIYLADESGTGEYGYTRDIDIAQKHPPGIDTASLESSCVEPPLHFQEYSVERWLVHPDWREASIDVSELLKTTKLTVRLLHPVDLIVTKLERAADQDIEDSILLMERYVADAADVEQRVREAAQHYPLSERVISQIGFSFAAIFGDEYDLSDLDRPS